jgi:hypothetical protein
MSAIYTGHMGLVQFGLCVWLVLKTQIIYTEFRWENVLEHIHFEDKKADWRTH